MKLPSSLPGTLNLLDCGDNADRMERVTPQRFHLRHLFQTARIHASAIAVASIAVTFACLVTIAYATSALMGRDLRFLDPYRQPSIDEAMVLCAMEYAVGCNEPNEVIFLGGSSCRCGIDPRQLRVSAHNLGSHAGLQPQAILLTLRGYLTHHPAPKLVVLCLSPISFDFRDDDEWATAMTTRFVADYGPLLGEPMPVFDTVERFVRARIRSVGYLPQARLARDEPARI